MNQSGRQNGVVSVCLCTKRIAGKTKSTKKKKRRSQRDALNLKQEMGALVKLLDVVLFPFLLTITFTAPLLGFQMCLPDGLYPDCLINLKQWYTHKFGDYLFVEKPNFFVGLVWLELLFQWPLNLINLYGILGAKSWLPTACLIYGTSFFTSMVAISAELIVSGKASDKMLKMYLPFLGFGVLAILRGLMPPPSGKANSIGRRPGLATKKKA